MQIRIVFDGDYPEKGDHPEKRATLIKEIQQLAGEEVHVFESVKQSDKHPYLHVDVLMRHVDKDSSSDHLFDVIVHHHHTASIIFACFIKVLRLKIKAYLDKVVKDGKQNV